MIMQIAADTETLPAIFYEDPEPIEDGMNQAPTILHLLSMLTVWFKDKNAFVSAGGFIFWNRLNGNERVAPDGFIALDTDPAFVQGFANYYLWEVGKAPDFVMEVASPSTAHNDMGYKRDLYAWLGVTEYWRFNPTKDKRYGPEIIGERLVDGQYVPYEMIEEPDGSVRSHSDVLGLDFVWTGFSYDIRDPLTGLSINMTERERIRADQAERAEERERIRATGQSKRAERAERHAKRERARADKAERAQERERARADSERQARIRLEEQIRQMSEDRRQYQPEDSSPQPST